MALDLIKNALVGNNTLFLFNDLYYSLNTVYLGLINKLKYKVIYKVKKESEN